MSLLSYVSKKTNNFVNGNYVEGNISDCPQKMNKIKEILLNKKDVKHIMEIGFNMGDSSELFLEYCPNAHVTSFDLGEHDCVKYGKEYIDITYPNRHELILGNSLFTIIQYVLQNPNKKFDILFIDGCHRYYECFLDLYHCKSFAHNNTIVIMDDTCYSDNYEKFYTIGPTHVWKEWVENKWIDLIECIDFSPGYGISYGKYNL